MKSFEKMLKGMGLFTSQINKKETIRTSAITATNDPLVIHLKGWKFIYFTL